MDDTIALIRKSHSGDKAAREQLVKENVGLVHCVVKRFLERGAEREDLFQIGSIGLLKAIDKFDLTYNVKFSTYAVPLISGEIKRFLRDDGMIKVSRSLKEIAYKSVQARERLISSLGRKHDNRQTNPYFFSSVSIFHHMIRLLFTAFFSKSTSFYCSMLPLPDFIRFFYLPPFFLNFSMIRFSDLDTCT